MGGVVHSQIRCTNLKSSKKKSLDFPEFFKNVYEDFINKKGFKDWIRGESSKKKFGFFGFFGGVYEDFFWVNNPSIFGLHCASALWCVCVCLQFERTHTRNTQQQKKKNCADFHCPLSIDNSLIDCSPHFSRGCSWMQCPLLELIAHHSTSHLIPSNCNWIGRKFQSLMPAIH